MLLPREIALAQSAANEYSKGKGRPHAYYDADKASFGGCCAELAASKFIGLKPIFSYEQRHAGDLEGGIEIKSTHWPTGRLLVRRDHLTKDKINRPFVLVRRHRHPWYELKGFMVGRDVMRPEWVQYSMGGEPYAVPNEQLRPMDELMEIIFKHQSLSIA